MKRNLLLWALLIPLALLMTSCLYRGRAVVVVGDGPGPEVVLYHYWYYPAWGIYYDHDANVYFYQDGPVWRRVVTLPPRYGELGDHVVVESERDRPWVRYQNHRAKYPPGEWEKEMREDGDHGRGHKHHFEDGD